MQSGLEVPKPHIRMPVAAGTEVVGRTLTAVVAGRKQAAECKQAVEHNPPVHRSEERLSACWGVALELRSPGSQGRTYHQQDTLERKQVGAYYTPGVGLPYNPELRGGLD